MLHPIPTFLLTLCVLIICAGTVQARPVSYPTGWTIMQLNDSDTNSLHVHYSPTVKYSIGYKAEHWRENEWQFHGLQLNYLLKRWNEKGSQANAYLKSGAGIAYSDFGRFNSEVNAAAFTGFAADWETRRHFVSYENRATYAGEIDSFFTQKARIGIAPYIGDYGDLHTWLMLQIEHQPEGAKHFTLTPLIRLFKGVSLIEAGMNTDGKIHFNTIIRF